MVRIQKASEDHLTDIITLVNEHARRGNLLPRSPRAIAIGLDDWLVAIGDEGILGCVSLLRYTSGLVEVRSLAVADEVQGNGVGSSLLNALIQEAKHRKIPTLFALTRAVRFFERNGFSTTEKAFFPEKVWHDCNQCPIMDRCDETAMVLHLQ